MRKIKEVLRLKFDNQLSKRQIAQSCSIAHSTVSEYLRRFREAPLSWPVPEKIDDNQLEQLLFPRPQIGSPHRRPQPDWTYIHRELRRKGVTLMLLWQEYKEVHPNGYQPSQFCHLYRQWVKQLDPVMRQEHRAGEKMFVDYAGMTVAVFDMQSAKMREAQIFVAVLGASNYTYAEATWSQALPDWIAAHTRAFNYFGGVAQVVVPDNLKAGVSKACFYEPNINPTYLDMANHYGTVVIPTRVRRPKDKAKVEVAVQIVERWILASLRDRQFFSLPQLNRAIAQLLPELNRKSFQKLPGSRKSMFESIDRPALKPLPVQAYQYAEWKKATVNVDYHIEVARHYYSVNGQRVASHIRSHHKARHSTIKEHMPKSHQKWAAWTPQRFINWAAKIGPHTARMIEHILNSRPHPQQGFRSCLGILRLAKDFGDARLEAACRRALAIGGTSYRSIESILKRNLDQKPLPDQPDNDTPLEHVNIRGSQYYH
jgi:transposase